MADIHKDRLIACNTSLFTSQMYSDIIIRCGTDEYKLHRAIICPRSTFFAAACNGAFMEAETATIILDDDEPQTVGRMLLYLYTLDYPSEDVFHILGECGATGYSSSPNSQRKASITTGEGTDSDTTSGVATPDGPRMMNNILVYAIAEKYDIPELKELARCKFHVLASSRWPHDGFDAIADAVFSTTPEKDMGLRQIVLDICEEHFFDILRYGEFRGRLLEIQAIAAVVHGAAVRKIDTVEMLLDGALANQIVIKEELSKAKADTQEAVDQKNKWMSQLDSLLKQGNNIHTCKYCRNFTILQWSVKCWGTSSELAMQLTCQNCRREQL